jgi:hypothetical protein
MSAKYPHAEQFKKNPILLVATDKNGNDVIAKQVEEGQIEDYIGKEAAKKIIEIEPDSNHDRILNNADLKVGGEGMKGFYDQVLPNTFKKVSRKLDKNSSVKTTTIQTEIGYDVILPNGKVVYTVSAESHNLESMKRTAEATAKNFDGAKVVPFPGVEVFSIALSGNAKQSAMKGQPLFQGERGSLSILPDALIVKLSESSDLTTFLHESGHVFLEMEKKLYSHPKATEQMKTDGDVILKWLGAKDFDSITVEQHEQWARGVEKYFSEGNAPSVDLLSVFRRFSQWIKQVYRDLTRLNVELNDEVRGVMDRLLATDEEINRIKGNFNPLFGSKEDAKMSEAEYKNYTRLSVPESAKDVLQAKMIKQLKRHYTKWWRDESAVVQSKVEEQLLKTPLYSALDFIRSKPENLEGEYGAGENKINHKDLETHFSGVIPGRFNGFSSDNGLSADEIAARFGFASGSELIDKINESPTFGEAVKAATQAEMVRRHGDILTDGTIEKEAEMAIRNVEHGKKLLAELNALSKITRTPAFDRESIRQYAKEKIGSMAYTQIKPAQYRASELRAARQAVEAKTKGDFTSAKKYKTQEVINFYLAKEAQLARDKAESNRKYLAASAVKEMKDVNSNYATQIRFLASLYDFRKTKRDDKTRAVNRLQSIAQWIIAQQGNEDAHVSPMLIDPTMAAIIAAEKMGLPTDVPIPSYRDMTADQIQAVADQVKNLHYVGRQLSDEQKALFKARTKQAAQSITDNAKGLVSTPQEPVWKDRFLSGLREFGEDHVRFANQIAEMDGYQDFGPMFQEVYQKIVDSSNIELKHKRDTLLKLKEAFKDHKHSDLKEGKGEKTIVGVSGPFTLSRRGRIMLALYWGSPEGREAIRIGHNVTDQDVQKMLDTMEDSDVNLVEQIWKINETFWPDVSRINQKMKGVTLPKVEHVPFFIGEREVPGGYMRLYYQYDTKDSLRDAKTSDELMTRSGQRLSAQTKHGSRNERVGSGGRRMSWDLNKVFQALDETIHDVSFAESASDVTRFMRSPEVASAIEGHYGKEKYQSMMSAVSGVIAGNIQNNHYINSFMRKFRSAQTYAFLGYSIRNLVQQPVALTNMFGKLGEKNVINGMIKFYMHPKETMKWVKEKSAFMEHRTSVVNRDSSEIMGQYSGQVFGGTWNAFKHHAFSMQTFGDALVAYPGWVAAYNDGIKKYGDEKKAVTYADEFVSSTIGSGLIKDQSPLLQGGGSVGQAVGPELLKGVTFMGSYFNVVYNLSRESYKKADLRSAQGVAEYTRQMSWYLMIPAILSALIVGDTPDEDDDESWLAWALETVSQYGMSQVFIVRDIASLMKGYGPSSSYTRALDASARLTKETYKIAGGEKELDAETAAKMLRAAGQVQALPGSGQAARILEYIGSDEEFNPYKAVVTGVDRN